MFWVRWRKLWMINWLLRHRNNLDAKEEKFLREIRVDLRTNRRKLMGNAWLYILYDRERRRKAR